MIFPFFLPWSFFPGVRLYFVNVFFCIHGIFYYQLLLKSNSCQFLMTQVFKRFLVLNQVVQMFFRTGWMTENRAIVKKISREKISNVIWKAVLLIHLGKEKIKVQEWTKQNTFERQKMSWMMLISTPPYLVFFVFTTECYKWVGHVTTKARRETEAASFDQKYRKRSCLTCLEKWYCRCKEMGF